MARRASTRRLVLTVSAATATAIALVAPAAVPASADHTALPSRVTLMGSLMDELGCDSEWDESCEATDMARVSDSSVFELVATVPAGNHEFKVRLNGSWDENYGDSEGTYDKGGNIPLPLTADAELRFTYDHDTHAVRVAPAEDPEPLQAGDRALAGTSLREDLTREQFYFVMADRFANGSAGNDLGGLTGSRLQTGFDPTSKGFYHGGDLQGLLDKLDYIEGLGTTAIWMTPSFKNKPVQGTPGSESAGYHGYWITDFTQIDPHLGTNADLNALIDAAHARGIKVFFDIITNHTADVLDYPAEEYTGDPANETIPYVLKEDEPYRDATGTEFDDRDYALGDTFPEIDAATSFPYVPEFRTEADENVKVPAWLNQPEMYHNRGTSSFAGENSEYGDFPGGDRQALDDLWTERPEVVNGMVDIYETWVRQAGVDGFRIDTVKHVNMEFWQRFAPALEGYAASIGNDDFFMFGEVFDANPEFMSRYTTRGRLQATVDFGFQGAAISYTKAGGSSAAKLGQFFASDDWFTDSDSNAYSLPTFLGNHDMGRIGKFLGDSGATGNELLERDQFAHALMYTTRGQPVIYYGDEQGFVGDGGDQDAREDMFPSQVASYNDNDLIGSDSTTAVSNYDPDHPLYQSIRKLSDLRKKHPTLADGAQIHRYADDEAGIYAFSRIAATGKDRNVEYVVAANSANTTKTADVPTYSAGQQFTSVWPRGAAAKKTDASGQLTVQVPARSVLVYRASNALKDDNLRPEPSVVSPTPGAIVEGRTPVAIDLPAGDFVQATVSWRRVGESTWTRLGTDDNAPYRVYHDVADLPKGAIAEYRIVTRDHDGDLGVASTWAVVGKVPVVLPPVSDVDQPAQVSVPGSHGTEIGCAEDWSPPCPQAQLTLGADEIWKGTFSPAAGAYAFKAAINGSWDENYGAKGIPLGADIGYTAPGTAVSFYYDHRTHWVTNTVLDDIVVATGSFQSEMGCASDGDVNCMRAWLQDLDGDKVYSLATTQVSAGTYDVRVAKDGLLEGPTQSFTVEAGDVTTFTYDPATQSLTVVTAPPAG